MSIWEYDEELHNQALIEDGIEIGEKRGELLSRLRLIIKKTVRGKSLENIAIELEETPEDIRIYYEEVLRQGEGCTAEQVYEALEKGKVPA